jgi:hypothetical protein
MYHWRRMQEVSWADFVRNEILHRVEGKSNFLLTIKRRMDDWIGHILCRKCLLNNIIQGKIGEIEVTERRGIRRKQLLDDLR